MARSIEEHFRSSSACRWCGTMPRRIRLQECPAAFRRRSEWIDGNRSDRVICSANAAEVEQRDAVAVNCSRRHIIVDRPAILRRDQLCRSVRLLLRVAQALDWFPLSRRTCACRLRRKREQIVMNVYVSGAMTTDNRREQSSTALCRWDGTGVRSDGTISLDQMAWSESSSRIPIPTRGARSLKGLLHARSGSRCFLADRH